MIPPGMMGSGARGVWANAALVATNATIQRAEDNAHRADSLSLNLAKFDGIVDRSLNSQPSTLNVSDVRQPPRGITETLQAGDARVIGEIEEEVAQRFRAVLHIAAARQRAAAGA